MLLFSVGRFGVSFCAVFTYMYLDDVYKNIVKFRLLSGHLYGDFLTRLTICFHSVVYHFGFEGRNSVLVAPVPVHRSRLRFLRMMG